LIGFNRTRPTNTHANSCGSPRIVEGSLCRFSVEGGGFVGDWAHHGSG